ncbi:type VI secretion system protein TssA [Pseudomonas sp. 21LCFQ02]|uniref:type VI secretion system protein TssA n=1 Tax=Pseudomonas sp. 21LCFQ02 TaxID=2957505 RepID=UPI00209AF26F|nr:type VI secretion system protein TssA [Pseudomonas sp. 21LCFQ02]MCO8170775.1 type VI secretion system protein TssA [Pseudomonas sp. 21LCFQ02]
MPYRAKLCLVYLEIAELAISERSFVGEDVRFCAEFEALEQEIAKAQSLHAGQRVDWLLVLERSEALLRNQSKDLRVAVWLTWALYQRESFVGLLAGIGMLEQLCSRHWASVHPLKPRTRCAAINWLLNRLDPLLGDKIAVGEQLELFRRLLTLLEALDRLFSEQLGTAAPLLLPLCRRLAAMIQRAQDNRPAVGVVEAVTTQVRQAASQWLAPSAEVSSHKQAQQSLRNLQEQAGPLCRWWLQSKACDFRAVHLSRSLLWLPVQTLPERNGEVTAVRGLAAEQLADYHKRFADGGYADLLIDLEHSLSQAPFWLDGQRMVWQCLEQLNADLAMRAVELHLALLLQRLPALAQLRFQDGRPFVDPATSLWITQYVAVHLQQAPLATVVEPAEADLRPAWEPALETAVTRLAKDGLKVAGQPLKAGLTGATCGRERFFWQLSLARLCFAAQQYELARIQLEGLDQLLLQAQQAGWEPQLQLQVLHLLHNCCERLPQNNAVRERKEEIFRRLCHLDPEVVLEQAQGPQTPGETAWPKTPR